MARDPTGVRPQGALSRHPADWFSDNLYTGGYSPINLTTPGTNGYFAVSLFNQDTQGRICKVYGISTVSYSGGGNGAGWVKGPFGSLVGPVTNARPDYPTPDVFIYQNSIIGPGGQPPYPASFPPISAIVGGSGFDSFTFLSPFPLFIVPVGWSLAVWNIVSDDFGGISFWFQLASV